VNHRVGGGPGGADPVDAGRHGGPPDEDKPHRAVRSATVGSELAVRPLQLRIERGPAGVVGGECPLRFELRVDCIRIPRMGPERVGVLDAAASYSSSGIRRSVAVPPHRVLPLSGGATS